MRCGVTGAIQLMSDSAEETLDMHFLGVAETAVGDHGPLARTLASFGGEVFGGVGFRSTRLIVVVEPGGPEGHEPRRLEFRPALGQGVLDGLVLADRTAKDFAFCGIGGGAVKRFLSNADSFGRHKNPLGVETVQQVSEALAFLADPISDGHGHVVEENLVGVHCMPAHLLDLGNLDVVPIEVGVEETDAIEWPCTFFDRSGAGKEEYLVGFLGRTCPHLLPVDEVLVTVAFGTGLNVRRIQAGAGFGDAEAGARLAANERWQPPFALFRRAEHHNWVGAKDVHVDRAGGAHRSGRLSDCVHQDGSLTHAEAGPTVLGWHRDTEPAAVGHGLGKLNWKVATAIMGKPIVVVKLPHEASDIGADIFLDGCEAEVHGRLRVQGECGAQRHPFRPHSLGRKQGGCAGCAGEAEALIGLVAQLQQALESSESGARLPLRASIVAGG